MLIEQIRSSVKTIFEELLRDGGYRHYLGSYSKRLEESLAQEHLNAHTLLTSSGTAALEIGLRAAGIGSGDEVILSAYDYPGNFWAIERVGARPVLVDIESAGWNIAHEQLDRALLEGTARRCKALVVSHLHGQLQATPELRQWCDRHELLMIEDNCQSLGATLAAVPSGTQGHASIVSFGGGKVLSAGRGGGLMSDSESFLQKARIAAGAGSGPYALSELQAAVILAQLAWLPRITQVCRDYFEAINQRLRLLNCHHIFPAMEHVQQTAFYQAGWILPEDQPRAAAASRDTLVAGLRQRGIAAGAGFSGFHRRSLRRCRLACGLKHAPSIAERTWVIHHSVALEGRLSPLEVADQIVAATAGV